MKIIIHGRFNDQVCTFTTRKEQNGIQGCIVAGNDGWLAIRNVEVLIHGEGGLTLIGYVAQPGVDMYKHEILTCTIKSV